MRTLIAAELASNHGGDLSLAKQFIRVAAAAGADLVKFQSWRAAQLRDGPTDPQYEWFCQAELTDDGHVELIEECHSNDIRFLTTAFTRDRISFLASLGLREIKVPSPDAANFRLLDAAMKHFSHVIVSVGLSSNEQVEQVIRYLEGTDFTICHCVSLYPTPLEAAWLDRIEWLRDRTAKIGYSDHTVGVEVPKAAVAKRVTYLEKHLCLGREGPGRVCAWDATPDELRELAGYAAWIEQVSEAPQEEAFRLLDEARAFYSGRFLETQSDE